MTKDKKKSVEEEAVEAVRDSLGRSDEDDKEMIKKIMAELSEEVAALSAVELRKVQKEFVDAIAPSKEELEAADNEMGIITLTTGKTAEGEDFYAYLSIKPSKYTEFLKLEETGGYSLSDFGEVLEYGMEKEPPPEVIKKMADEYGASHSFEEDFVKEMEKYLVKKES